MDALIDSALETIMHSAIWRMTYHMEFVTLVIIALGAFVLLAWRRTRRSEGRFGRRGYRYRKRYGRGKKGHDYDNNLE